MSKFFRSIKECRLCSSNKITDLLSLGPQTLTGVFPKKNQPDPIAVPLDLVLCENCDFLQLKYTVNPELMYSEYWYRSGINKTMRDHLTSITSEIKEKIFFNEDDCVIDIGCNDGTLLNSYGDLKIKKIGVDPSDAIDSIQDPNIIKINTFFSEQAIKDHLHKKAKVITSISMFYDLDDPNSFVADIKSSLAQDGIWVLEMNYTGTMIKDLGYDMISHEHVAYYTLTTFEKLINKHDLYVNDVSYNSINGGSIRIFCGFNKMSSSNVKQMLTNESNFGFDKKSTYENYSNRIAVFKKKLVNLIHKIRSQNKTIAVYGASTRGNTILQHCEFTQKDLFAAADRNPGKWGLVTPGTRIPIESEESVRSMKPDYMLILPYGFLDEFLEREKDYLQSGGKLIVPLPELCIYSWNNNRIEMSPVTE